MRKKDLIKNRINFIQTMDDYFKPCSFQMFADMLWIFMYTSIICFVVLATRHDLLESFFEAIVCLTIAIYSLKELVRIIENHENSLVNLMLIISVIILMLIGISFFLYFALTIVYLYLLFYLIYKLYFRDLYINRFRLNKHFN